MLLSRALDRTYGQSLEYGLYFDLFTYITVICPKEHRVVCIIA